MADDIRVFHVTVTYNDAEQETATTSYHIRANMGTDIAGNPITTFDQLQTDVESINSLMDEVTGLGINHYVIGWERFYTRLAGPTDTPYGNTEDKLQLVWADADGRAVKQLIPGPRSAVFLADTETFDRTETDITNLITVMTTMGANGTQVVSSAGSVLKELDFGTRVRRKSKRERPGRSGAIG